VGFEEDLRRRRTDLEKAFISSQRTSNWGSCALLSFFEPIMDPLPHPLSHHHHHSYHHHHHTTTALSVTVQLQSGVRYHERVSPLKTMAELYDTLVNGNSSSNSSSSNAAGPIVAMDFEDINSAAPAVEAEGALG
jgi:hypothetical protein